MLLSTLNANINFKYFLKKIIFYVVWLTGAAVCAVLVVAGGVDVDDVDADVGFNTSLNNQSRAIKQGKSKDYLLRHSTTKSANVNRPIV